MRRMLTRDRATLTPRFRLLIESKRQLADEVGTAAFTPEVGKPLRMQNGCSEFMKSPRVRCGITDRDYGEIKLDRH